MNLSTRHKRDYKQVTEVAQAQKKCLERYQWEEFIAAFVALFLLPALQGLCSPPQWGPKRGSMWQTKLATQLRLFC